MRRVKRASKLYKARGLFGATMASDIELMKELRWLKTGKGELDELPDTVKSCWRSRTARPRWRR